MTDYKILGQEAPSADTETDLYTVPGDKSTVVRAINVTNTASASDTFDIANIESSLVDSPTFIAVGGPENLLTYAISTNGTIWTQGTFPASSYWSGTAYGNGIFIAISGFENFPGAVSSRRSNIAAISTNGTTWTQTTMPQESLWGHIKYGNNTFVALSTTYYGLGLNDIAAATSTDGITWTQGTIVPEYTDYWSDMEYGNNTFVAITGHFAGNNSNIAAISTNGIAWTQITLPSSVRWSSIAYGNNTFVAVALGTAAASSTDGITWTARTLPSSQFWFSTAYGSNIFVAVVRPDFTDTSVYATSSDGISWTQRTLPVTGKWQDVVYGNNYFVAIASEQSGNSTQKTLYSTDAITWTQGTLPIASRWQSISYADAQSITYPSTSNADYIFKSHEILGNETITIKGGYTLDSNNKLKIKSTNGTSTFHAFGGEI